jgi:hypothetical protein
MVCLFLTTRLGCRQTLGRGCGDPIAILCCAEGPVPEDKAMHKDRLLGFFSVSTMFVATSAAVTKWRAFCRGLHKGRPDLCTHLVLW